jgi:S-DNA-T family DNA segregation ATPase FtsK/SpoIIIE
MAKRKNKNSNNYSSNVMGIAICLLSLLALFEAGVVGTILFEMFEYLFGEVTELVLSYIVIISFIVAIGKLKDVFKSKIGIALNLLIILIVFLITIYYFYLTPVLPTPAAFKEILRNPDASHGTGILGYYMYASIYKLFGYIGLFIVSTFLTTTVIYLIIDSQKTKNQSKPINKRKINRKVKQQQALEKTNNTIETPTDELEVGTGVTMYEMDKNSPLVDTETINIQNENKKTITFYDDGIEEYNRTMAFSKEEIDEVQRLAKQERELEKIDTKDIYMGTAVPIFMQTMDEKNNDYTVEKKARIDNVEYIIPKTDLLNDYGNNIESLKLLERVAVEKGDLLVTTLASFKLKVKLLNIHIGPNVTKYELQPEPGVKVSRFASLSNDIALSLAASNVRIEAPIPGKAAVGIEIPNEKTMMVGLREVLESKNNDFNNKLQIGLGKDISGSSIFTEIDSTPHLLVAGATGSGKSVCINSIIISILMKATPDEVKMVMIDPKKVELAPYNGIPHLLTPVVTEPKKAAIILQKMVAEMENRYELFAETNTRNIKAFNEKVENSKNSYSKLPYIVIVVDELADLMMVASNEVETSIARLAQMARAAGMHLIIATQRPSTDVITGLIKANIPSRIAFSVSSGIDSRTILDSSGAEKLLGRGDMLLSEQSSPNLTRIQGAFLSDDEVYRVVEFITDQIPHDTVESNYDQELLNVQINDLDEELDELYDEVLNDVVQMQKASASFIQRKYRVGYNRALRIMDQLEANGVISANEGPKPRRVLIGDENEGY